MKLSLIKIVLMPVALLIMSFLSPPNRKFATFKAIKLLSYSDTTLGSSGFTAITTLYETPPYEELNPYKGIQDGVIKLNSRALFYNQVINMYLDSVRNQNLDSIRWNITNSVNFSNINYKTIKPIPTFTNIASIPKMLCKNNDYVLAFGNITNVDKIEFTIDNGQFFTSLPFYRKVPANISCLTIPKIHLACLNVNNPTFVKVSFINEEEVDFGGKKFVFENRLQITKLITITN